MLNDRERAKVARRARWRFRRSEERFRRVFADALRGLGLPVSLEPERLPDQKRARFFDVMGTVSSEYAVSISRRDGLGELRGRDELGELRRLERRVLDGEG